VVTEISELPPRERAKRYRELAARAEHYAVVSKDPSSKDSYARLAKQWLRLAEEIEAEINRKKD